MKRVAWLTDIHLDVLDEPQLAEFFALCQQTDADAFLLGGDIAESRTLVSFLERLDEHLQRPIYFVLGNHDFYRGSIREVRDTVTRLCQARPRLTYLSTSEPIALADDWGLVGHDGWADARIGDYERSLVMMHDYELIAELAKLGKQARWPLLQALGDEAAAHIRRTLSAALAQYKHVTLLTHIPPLRSACWYNGEVSDDEWAPHFTCKAVGDAILDLMRVHPDHQLTVLCGHTHSPGETHPLPNVKILTAGAEYGHPVVQRVFESSV